MGLFVTFEGTEGSGKTTQIKKAGDYLREKNIPFIITEEPGGTGLGSELRSILLNGISMHITGNAELFLFAADRAQHIEEVILPAIREGKIVLCDRFSDATMAYQGYGRGLELDVIRAVNNLSSKSLKPDLTFLFDVPVDIGLKRIAERTSREEASSLEDRFENEKEKFHKRVREGYLAIAGDEPERFRVIDGSKGIDEINREVCRCLSELVDG
jgi:dTMP kinase